MVKGSGEKYFNESMESVEERREERPKGEEG